MMGHSPLGGSVASRFMACPGSARLIASLPEVEDPLREEEWRAEGTAAHALAAEALWTNQDAWEVYGELKPLPIDDQIAVQEYLDYVRSQWKPGQLQFVEVAVGHPSLHKYLYGQLDAGQYIEDEAFLEIIDYKHGIGVVVSAVQNKQLMYYAFCKVLEHPECQHVKMTIVQPRAFHEEGPVRSWECTAKEILEWGYGDLLPAMREAEVSDKRVPGPHCQFCPAKLHCPEALAWFDEASVETNTSAMTDDRLSERFDKIQVVMFVRKAIEQEVLRRQLLGHKISTAKLVLSKTDRVFKEGAEVIFTGRFGTEAYNKPSLKSPAQMEKITGAKELVKHWAYTPQRNFVTARVDDRRHEVKPPSAADAFKQYAAGVDNADQERSEIDTADTA